MGIGDFLTRLGERLGLVEPEDEEIKRLTKAEGTCSVCGAKIKNKQVYLVPGSKNYYCRMHAKEEAERVREETFKDLPLDLKGKVKFTQEAGFYLQCKSCEKTLPIMQHEWRQCDYCHDPYCKEHQEHECEPKKAAARQAELAKMPKRCGFCGKKITGAANYHCPSCDGYFCDMHREGEHHDCKHMR